MQNLYDKKSENIQRIEEYWSKEEKGYAEFYPRYIQLEHTNRCNAQCIMCNHFYLENKGASDISEEVIKRVEPILPYCQVLMLNGDGEPFLCKNIESYIGLYRKYGVKVSTNTNFCCVPEKIWTLFEDSFDLLNISCDGASKQTFEYIRRNLKFDVFCENLRRLNRVAPRLRKHLDCVIMRQNIREAAEIVNFADAYGFEKVKFHMLGVNPCIGNQNDSARQFLSEAAFYMQQAWEAADRLGIAVEIPAEFEGKKGQKDTAAKPFYDGQDIDMSIKKEVIQKKYKDLRLNCDYLKDQASQAMLEQASYFAERLCRWAVERCYIDLEGNVTTCCYNTRYHFGNLKEYSFDEIWNGKLYRTFRKAMAKRRLPEWCRECNWLKE